MSDVADPIYVAIDYAGDSFLVFPRADDGVVVKTPGDAVLLDRQAVVNLIVTLQKYLEGPESGIHTLVVDDDGWMLSHTAACTPDPDNCPYKTAVANIRYGQFPPGKYRAGLDDHGNLTVNTL